MQELCKTLRVRWRPGKLQNLRLGICYQVLRPSQVTGKPATCTGIRVGLFKLCGRVPRIRATSGRKPRDGEAGHGLDSATSIPFFFPFPNAPILFLWFLPLQNIFFISFSPSCWSFYLNTAGSNWRPGSRIVQTRRLGCRLQAPWGIARYEVPRPHHSMLRTWFSLLRTSTNGVPQCMCRRETISHGVIT